MTTYTPADGQITRLTVSAALASQALRIARVSGSVRIVGWSCYAAGAGPIVYNCGRSGWRADQYADDTAFYSPANAIAALDADLCLIELGLNDRTQAIPIETFRTSLVSIISACAPADVALVVSFYPAGTSTYAWTDYVAAILDVAATYDLPVVDITQRWGDRATVEAAGWAANAAHPTAAGLADKARAIHNLIAM